MKKVITILIILALAFSLCSCAMVYTDKEIREIYNEGFSEGYRIGLDEGAVEGTAHFSDFITKDSSYAIMKEYLEEARAKLDDLHIIGEEYDDAMQAFDDALFFASEFEWEVNSYLP